MPWISQATAKPNSFFSSNGQRDENAGRRLLLISYYFPPVNDVGALRWQKLSRHAAERGWALDVVMVDPASTDTIDEGRLSDLPPGMRLFAIPDVQSPIYRFQISMWKAVRPLARGADAIVTGESPWSATAAPSRNGVLSRRPSFLRAYLAWLQLVHMKRWAAQAARAGIALGEGDRTRHSVVVSSGPPHIAHEAGRRVAERLRLPFVMDMRDPWASAENMPPETASDTWMWLARSHERRCVEAASKVFLTSEASRLAMCARYPQLADRFLTVMNGADAMTVPRHKPRKGGPFIIAYAGTLYCGRNPRNLFRAVGRVVKELSLPPDALRVEFMGGEEFEGIPLSTIAGEEGVAGYVTSVPLAPRSAALNFLARATMLVTLPQDAHLAIPAKVFEYVQFDAWLLVLAARGSATELLFRDSQADVLDPADVEGIAALIRRRYTEHVGGAVPAALNGDGRFNRSRQAEVLLDALEQCL